MTNSSTLAGNVALITGGTSGIGRATALAAASRGIHIVVTGRRAPEGQAVVEQAKAAGKLHSTKAVFVQGDMSKEADVQRAVEAAAGLNGTLNFAFNNAGVELSGVNTSDSSPEQFHKIFDINVLGVLLSMKHEIRAMTPKGKGSIVNTASIAASIGMPGVGIYVASKHAVVGLTKAAALELAQFPFAGAANGAKGTIRVNTVSPAAIDTDMVSRFTNDRNADAMKWLTSMHPVGRMGQSIEIAKPVLFLWSDEASFITGQDLKIDGGFTAQ